VIILMETRFSSFERGTEFLNMPIILMNFMLQRVNVLTVAST
jgi:hypothetical protein